MNKIVILFGILLIACTSNESPKQLSCQTLLTGTQKAKSDQRSSVEIDISRSLIKWKGTKLMGAGSHEGTVSFKRGNMEFDDGRLARGSFIVDMKSIYNTDIPLSDPEPRKNLTTHLNADFETDTYRESGFEIRDVKHYQNGKMQIAGDMTIKGIARSLTFEGKRNGDRFTAEIIIDREKWKIGEQGSWLERKLVDAEFNLAIEIYLTE